MWTDTAPYGLWLLARGLTGYRDAIRIGDTATSRIATLAAGEVQVSGAIEPAELTLISPLRSTTCVCIAPATLPTTDP